MKDFVNSVKNTIDNLNDRLTKKKKICDCYVDDNNNIVRVQVIYYDIDGTRTGVSKAITHSMIKAINPTISLFDLFAKDVSIEFEKYFGYVNYKFEEIYRCELYNALLHTKSLWKYHIMVKI